MASNDEAGGARTQAEPSRTGTGNLPGARLQKEDTHRKRWEAHWSEDQKDKDEKELAKRLQSLDNVFGEGITYNKVQAKLATLREDEDERWQREHGDKQYTGGKYKEDNARWEHHS